VIPAARQQRVRVLEALELRVKQFRSRDGLWPFRVPHEPLELEEIIRSVLDGDAKIAVGALRTRTVLELGWDSHRWELWVVALPSGLMLYCDSDGTETRLLASARRGNPGEADGFFLERLAESKGHDFGIEMAGPPPERVRSSIGDREFLADVFVELFEGTDAERALGRQPRDADFRAVIVAWLDDVLTAPPPGRRQPRLRDLPEAE
jgi:hypothetical protein